MAVDRVDPGVPGPRYLQVVDMLRRRIAAGELPVGTRIPSDRDLAAQMGVSPVTVSRALQRLSEIGMVRREVGRGTFVISCGPQQKLEVHLRVLFGTGLAPETVRTDYYLGPLLRGLIDEASRQGVLFSFGELRSGQGSSKVESVNNDALIFVTPTERHVDLLQSLYQAKRPFVLLGAHWGDLPAPSVDSDNFEAGRRVAKRLARLHHRRIAFLGAFADAPNTRDRLLGFKAGLAEVGLPIDQELITVVPDNTKATVEEVIQGWMGMHAPPTAVFAAGYELSVWAYKSILGAGRSIPDDVSLVGFDDNPADFWDQNPITTVIQPLYRMGVEAVRLALVNRRAFPPNGRSILLLPCRYVERGSTAKWASCRRGLELGFTSRVEYDRYGG